MSIELDKSLINATHKRIPLALAERFIIPYYLKRVDTSDPKIASSFIDNMLAITGSYHIGLKITKFGKDNDEVLYTLPPLLGSLKNDLDLGKYIRRYEAVKDNNPAKADAMLRGAMGGASDGIEMDNMEMYKQNIRALYTDYGLSTPEGEITQKAEAVEEEDIYEW